MTHGHPEPLRLSARALAIRQSDRDPHRRPRFSHQGRDQREGRVRAVALEVLAEASERALARDLRNTWAARDGVEVDLGFADTGDLAVLDAAARRSKYVQWDEVLPAVPDLIDDAARLDEVATTARTAGTTLVASTGSTDRPRKRRVGHPDVGEGF